MAEKMNRREFGRRSGLAVTSIAGAALASGILKPPAAAPADTGASRPSRAARPPERTYRVAIRTIEGAPAPKSQRQTLYASDLHFEPERKKSRLAPDGTVEIATSIAKAAFHAKIGVPGFGAAWVTADNEGKGYSSAKGTLDFVAESARTRLADVDRLLKSSGAKFSPECLGHRDAARENLAIAARSNGQKAARHNMMALSHALWAGELAIVEHSRHLIAARPPRRNFLFGCNAFAYKGPGPYASYFRRAMNYATLPFYLRRLEPARGKPDYSRVDRILEWCEKVGIRPKGHPLWWGHEAGIPDWLKGADWETARRECARVVGRSVERYRGRIDFWDVINEAHDWANGLRLTHEQEVEITRVCCETARAKNPKATIVVNNCCPFGEYAAQGRVHLGPVYDKIFTPLAYLRALLDAGVDFDVVGVQLYFPARDMLAISKLLDEYARIGKTVHITELGVRSEGGPRRGDGEWHRPWCEKVQADWMEWFYTIAYARPEIEAITWWNFSDPAFIPTSGFLRRDRTPREIFFRFEALKKTWGFAS